MSYATIPDFSAGELTSAELNVVVDAINALFPVGFYAYICKAATTTETLVNGVWLECNATSVLRATYPDLNTLLASLSYPFGTIDGTHMTLPDAQGRAAVSMASGGAAAVNALGAGDGITKNSRSPKASLSITVSGGTTGSESSHTHGPGSYTTTLPYDSVFGSGGLNAARGGATVSVAGTSGAGSSHTHSYGGGSGSAAQTGPYLVAGTLFIKAKA